MCISVSHLQAQQEVSDRMWLKVYDLLLTSWTRCSSGLTYISKTSVRKTDWLSSWYPENLWFQKRSREMESNEASVEYNRWSEENINMKVPNSQSRLMGVYNRLCTGQLGIAMKLAALVVVIVVIFLLGYVTGYYVHRCWQENFIYMHLDHEN